RRHDRCRCRSLAAVVGDHARGARRQLEPFERDLVGVRVAAARAGEDAYADALPHVARRLLDDTVLERCRLHAGELEVAIGPVGAALEGRAEHTFQRAAAQAEALEQKAVGALGLHCVSTLAEGSARANVMEPSGMDTRRTPGHTPAHSMASPPSRGAIASLLHVLDRPGPL